MGYKREGKHTILKYMVYVSPLVMLVISLYIGRYDIAGRDVIYTLLSKVTGQSYGIDPRTISVIWDIRLARALIALLVGGGLAISGATLQGMFKNPLIDSGMLGVSAGASFGAVVSILTFGNIFAVTFVMAFIFGIIAAGLSFTIGTFYKSASSVMLVLGGVIVTSLFSSLVSLGKYMADPFDSLPTITFWLMGSLANKGYEDLLYIILPMAVGIIGLIMMRWRVNILSMGDKEAISLGIKVRKNRLIMIGLCTLVTAAAVSISGTIGWVGLIIPHIIRMIFGNDHKKLLPSSLALGGTFLLLIDTIARSLTSAEIPIGVLTALIGAPFYIVLLRKTRGGGW